LCGIEVRRFGLAARLEPTSKPTGSDGKRECAVFSASALYCDGMASYRAPSFVRRDADSP